MAVYANVCRFRPTAGGTTDWTYSAAVVGYSSPALAGLVNGATYRYRAESADMTQWEIGTGVYNSGTGVLTRATVLANSSGTGTAAGQSGAGSKINFTAVPQVAIVALKEDVPSLTATNAFTDTTEATGAGTTAAALFAGGVEIAKKLFVAGTVALATASGSVVKVGPGADAAGVSAAALLVTNVADTAIAVRDSTSDVEAYLYAYSGGAIIGTFTNHALAIRTNNTDRISVGTNSVAVSSTILTTTFSSTSAATSTTTGAIRNSGGLGVAGAAYVGGNVVAQANVIIGASDAVEAGTFKPKLTVSANTVAAPVQSTMWGTALAQFVAGAAQNGNICVHSFGTNASKLWLTYSNGTLGSPTAATTNDHCAAVVFSPYNATTGYTQTAIILGVATEPHTNVAQGMRLDIYATPTGGTATAVAASFGAGFMVGTTTDPGAGAVKGTGHATFGGDRAAASPALFTVNRGSGAAPSSAAQFGNAVAQFNGADAASAIVVITSTGTGLPLLTLAQARGVTGALTATQDGDFLGAISALGYHTSASAAYVGSASINFVATDNFTSTVRGAKVAINATPDGGAATATCATFQAGLMVGGTTDPGAGCLRLFGTTAATSTTTGTLIVDGGLGMAGALWVGTTAQIGNGSDASSFGAQTLFVNVNGTAVFVVRDSTNNIEFSFSTNTTSGGIGLMAMRTAHPLWVQINGANLFAFHASGGFSVGTTTDPGTNCIGAAGSIIATGGVAATSTTTGTLRITGGAGISGAVWVGTTLNVAGVATVASGTATPAAGSTAARLLFGTTAGFGIYYGSGAPTVSAGQGSLYLRSDGSSTSTRLYVNTTGSTTWTNFTSAA
jgi:hypothetical protein